MSTNDTIYFYGTKDEHGYMSNFAAYPIVIDGVVWPTTEHYFQAMKFVGSEHVELIRKCASPATAARMGRSRKRPLRADWERVKDDVMRLAVWQKFLQHPAIAALLLATGDAKLVEKTTRDTYWGCGTRGDGKNMLGVILVEVRQRLRERE
jgi:ribA/ribD-fused uncharacterized protein